VSTLSNTQGRLRAHDFHLINSNGTYSTYNGNINYDDEWQDLNYSAFGLDIAQEDPNTNFGPNANDDLSQVARAPPTDPSRVLSQQNVTVATNAQGGAVHPFDARASPFPKTSMGCSFAPCGGFLDPEQVRRVPPR